MKALKYTAVILLLLVALACYALFAPIRGRSLGVSIVSHGFQTNATGQLVPMYAITNRSTRAVLIIPSIERRPAPALWLDMLGNTQTLLAAHSEILVTISNTPPEHAAVHCQRERYFDDTAGTAKRLFDTYLFCRKETEIVYAR